MAVAGTGLRSLAREYIVERWPDIKAILTPMFSDGKSAEIMFCDGCIRPLCGMTKVYIDDAVSKHRGEH